MSRVNNAVASHRSCTRLDGCCCRRGAELHAVDGHGGRVCGQVGTIQVMFVRRKVISKQCCHALFHATKRVLFQTIHLYPKPVSVTQRDASITRRQSVSFIRKATTNPLLHRRTHQRGVSVTHLNETKELF